MKDSFLYLIRNVAVGSRGALAVRQQDGHTPVHTQGQGVILGDHSQQRQAGLVDGIVNGGVELAQQLFAHPIHHQVQGACREAIQLHDGVLGVPQGGGVRSGHHHAAVRGAGGQLKAPPQARRCVQQTEVKPPAYLPQQICHLDLRHRATMGTRRRGQQEKAGDLGVFHSGQF